MASSTTDEKQSIRESAKQPKKYGSFCNHVSRQDNCIKHIIVEGDTLQGIALKYGVTMEQIRRLNRLWATDSLFLREYLLIPVPADKALSASQSSTDVNPARSPGSPDSTHSEERSINDFLVHIDNSIANMKSQVKKTQGNSENNMPVCGMTSFIIPNKKTRKRQANSEYQKGYDKCFRIKWTSYSSNYIEQLTFIMTFV
ncbi:lysM and putative peptidoglycan-binding domain-containing protein 2 isoform X3 [Schistocerca gregaria]|uniref:lysM and putative peptidoglycan-binding domain-containing protein 2 isoform X3 n=1 Tax=Schistocerca gregaria TaxID=7010 RepID=UPI00211F1572|nr:lysM and putative peptidoglycan-binding domain-containing protein 2 isoform X3 [Schistocerca gregaria]